MAEDDEDKHSKTQEPTPQKLKKAREKGDVPSSREVGTMMTVLSLLALTFYLVPQVMPALSRVLATGIEAAGAAQIGEGAAGMRDLGGEMHRMGSALMRVLAPVMLLFVLAALAGVAIQGETVVAVERIKPKLSKISPLAGFKRLFSADAFVEFGKSVVKVLVVGGLAGWLTYRAVVGIWQSEAFLPETILSYVQTYVGILLAIVAVFTSVVALADVIFKRIRWNAKQRMTLKEVRDEHKEQEGDPMIKGKRMGIRRKQAQQRIAAAVSEATVVLTNPTHYAVVLKYDPKVESAPICTAKGADLMAANIRRLAREADVPVVENRPLARALYDVAELDQVIPVEHWQTVAGIIRYILDVQAKIRSKLPEGSSLRED